MLKQKLEKLRRGEGGPRSSRFRSAQEMVLVVVGALNKVERVSDVLMLNNLFGAKYDYSHEYLGSWCRQDGPTMTGCQSTLSLLRLSHNIGSVSGH